MKLLLRHSIKPFNIYLFCIGFSAVIGGISLVRSNGMGMPVEWLISSPFHSYLIPGIILSVIVGGTHVLAAIFVWRKQYLSEYAAAVAGFGLLIWIFSEIYLTHQIAWLQSACFTFGIITTMVTLVFVKERILV